MRVGVYDVVYSSGMRQVSVSKARSIIVLAEVENADQVFKACIYTMPPLGSARQCIRTLSIS